MDVVVVTVAVDDGTDNLDVADAIVEVTLPVVVVAPTDNTASAHTSIGDGCVSFAKFSSVNFVSTRGGTLHMDGFVLGSGDVSVLSALLVVVELTVAVAPIVVIVVVVSREFELSDDVVVGTAAGVHIELDE